MLFQQGALFSSLTVLQNVQFPMREYLDLSPKLRRHAHFDELPSFRAIVAALGAARQYLPAGLANWTRHDQNTATAPLRGFDTVNGSAETYNLNNAQFGVLSAVPEPGTWAMMLFGIGGVGFAMRRRTSKVNARARFAL